MEVVTILLRTLLTYFFILLLLRLMGKRELGKLSVFDVVISIMLAEMAVLAIEEVKEPMINYFLPMSLLGLLEIGFAYITLKSKKMRDIIDGSAELLIENGQIREEAMKRNRMNLDDLMVHLRQKNISNIAEVEFAVLEPTGQMSVFRKRKEEPPNRGDLNMVTEQPVSTISYSGLPIPLIMDGKIREEALNRIGRNKLWLKQMIRKHGIKKVEEVSFCSIDHFGNIYIDLKDKPLPRR